MDQNKLAYLREWQKKHPEKIREYRKRYYELNAERLKARSREYYKNNTQHMIEKSRAWREKNKDLYLSKQREYNRKRKEAKLLARWPETFLEMIYASCKNKDWIKDVTDEMMCGNDVVDWTGISERNKEIVLQRYRDGMKCREIAEIHGISMQRASAICLEIINRLRDRAEGYSDQPRGF